jgi:hypothetical protein
MNEFPRDGRVNTARWSDLVSELDEWGEIGRTATLWWRDDDAVKATRRLHRLLSIAAYVPISLAVIPAAADAELAEWLNQLFRLGGDTRIGVLQHGWRHINYAGNGKKSEFPPGRSRVAVTSDLATGQSRLTKLFGPRAVAVLVPPWNRFDPCFLPLLVECGLMGVSCVNPRRAPQPAPGIAQVNVHVDLVSWSTDRRFIGEAAALGGIVAHLRARRLLEVDAVEPTGILTHHLVQDEQTEGFLRRFIDLTRDHPATRWLDAADVFAEAVCRPQ